MRTLAREVRAAEEAAELASARSVALGAAASVAHKLASMAGSDHAALNAWTKEWNIDPRDIEAWYAKRTEQRKQGDEDKTSTAQAGNNKEFVGGKGGPNPSVELQYSFVDDKPSIVALDFFWPRPSGTENGTPAT